MSFVQKLRMNNIFPTTRIPLGWEGRIPSGGNSRMGSIVGEPDTPQVFPQAPVGNGNFDRLADMMSGKGQPQFGGARYMSDPWAGHTSSQELYEKNGQPQVTAGQILAQSGIKPNEQFPGFDDSVNTDLQLNRELKKAQIDATRQRATDSDRRLDIAEFKNKNPNKKFIPVKGGNIMAFDPITGESEDTGIATNTLTEKARLELIQQNTMAKQNDAQAEVKPLMPTQQAHEIKNRMIEAINRNPAWKQYINVESGEIAPIGEGASMWSGSKGLDENTRKAIIDAVYGTPPAVTTPVTPPPAGGATTPNMGGYPTGTMERKNPQTGAIESSVAPPPTAPAPNAAPSAVGVQQKVVGQIYTLGNGTTARWDGDGFTPVAAPPPTPTTPAPVAPAVTPQATTPAPAPAPMVIPPLPSLEMGRSRIPDPNFSNTATNFGARDGTNAAQKSKAWMASQIHPDAKALGAKATDVFQRIAADLRK